MIVIVTKRQLEILDLIQQSIDSDGRPPTIREIKNGLKIVSHSGVIHHLERLVDANLITRTAFVSRGIKITELGKEQLIAYREERSP